MMVKQHLMIQNLLSVNYAPVNGAVTGGPNFVNLMDLDPVTG